MIKSGEIFNGCEATDDQRTVYKKSQQVPGIKIESYILDPFLNTLSFLGWYHEKKFNIVLNKVKK